MNVEQIVKKAQNYEYNEFIPLKYWLRTAGILLKEVLLIPLNHLDDRYGSLRLLYRQTYTSTKATTSRPTFYFSGMRS